MAERIYIAQRQPLLRRGGFFLRLWALKATVRVYLWSQHLLSLVSKRPGPSYTKTYSALPSIEARVFVPSSYKAGSKPLPLLIDIHGGGFAIGAPLLDDGDNLILSNDHGICVVAIGYRLAPMHPFPSPVHDCAAMIRAVLDDPDLPVDKSKVAVGGYSAGGNLSLASTQMNGLNKEIKGVVAVYPATNSTIAVEEKLANATPPPGHDDFLKDMATVFNWGYVAPGTDKRNPLLNPYFAERDALPEKLYMLGCEYDLLCPEAEETAEKYAEGETGEKVVDEDGTGWTKGRVRWRKIMDVEHGFNTKITQMRGGKERDRMIEVRADMHADIARWLKAEVYA